MGNIWSQPPPIGRRVEHAATSGSRPRLSPKGVTRKLLRNQKTTAYHFGHLEGRIVLHRHDAGDGRVWSTIPEACREGSVQISLYFNRDPLGG